MPRKNKEEYNAYMKQYMKDRYHAKKSATGQTNSEPEQEPEQFDPAQGTEAMPKELMEIGKELVSKQAEKGDKTFGMIEKVLEHAPMVVGLIQKFAQGMADSQARQPQQAQAPPQPPIHYGTPKAVQYLDDPAWVAQRDAYLAYRSGQPVTQAPQPMAENYQREARQQQRQGLPAPQQKLTMEQLNREATADLKPVEPEQKGIPNDQRPHDPRLQAMADKEKESKEPEQVDEVIQEQKDAIINELRKDNEKAVELVVGWINGQTDEQLTKKLGQDEPFKEAYKFLGFLPIQYRDMIVTLDADQVFTILEGGCPDKMKLVKKLKKTAHLKKAWTQLQDKIKPKS